MNAFLHACIHACMATHEYMNVQVDIDGGGKLDLFEFFRAMVEKGPALALSLSHEELAKRFKISEKDVERIRSNFCEHDDDGSGTVDVEELAQILHEMGVDLKPGELAVVIRDIDSDGSGELDLLEFMQMMVQCGGVETDELGLARKTFQKYDTDKSQKIDFDEFRKCMNELNPSMTDAQVRACFTSSDLNNDGAIGWQEFLASLGLQDEEGREMEEQLKLRRGADELSLEERYAYFSEYMQRLTEPASEYDRERHHRRKPAMHEQYLSYTHRFARNLLSTGLSEAERAKIIRDSTAFHFAVRGEVDFSQIRHPLDTWLARGSLLSDAAARMSTKHFFEISVACKHLPRSFSAAGALSISNGLAPSSDHHREVDPRVYFVQPPEFANHTAPSVLAEGPRRGEGAAAAGSLVTESKADGSQGAHDEKTSAHTKADEAKLNCILGQYAHAIDHKPEQVTERLCNTVNPRFRHTFFIEVKSLARTADIAKVYAAQALMFVVVDDPDLFGQERPRSVDNVIGYVECNLADVLAASAAAAAGAGGTRHHPGGGHASFREAEPRGLVKPLAKLGAESTYLDPKANGEMIITARQVPDPSTREQETPPTKPPATPHTASSTPRAAALISHASAQSLHGSTQGSIKSGGMAVGDAYIPRVDRWVGALHQQLVSVFARIADDASHDTAVVVRGKPLAGIREDHEKEGEKGPPFTVSFPQYLSLLESANIFVPTHKNMDAADAAAAAGVGAAHRPHEGVMSHLGVVTKKEAQAIFDTHCLVDGMAVGPDDARRGDPRYEKTLDRDTLEAVSLALQEALVRKLKIAQQAARSQQNKPSMRVMIPRTIDRSAAALSTRRAARITEMAKEHLGESLSQPLRAAIAAALPLRLTNDLSKGAHAPALQASPEEEGPATSPSRVCGRAGHRQRALAASRAGMLALRHAKRERALREGLSPPPSPDLEKEAEDDAREKDGARGGMSGIEVREREARQRQLKARVGRDAKGVSASANVLFGMTASSKVLQIRELMGPAVAALATTDARQLSAHSAVEVLLEMIANNAQVTIQSDCLDALVELVRWSEESCSELLAHDGIGTLLSLYTSASLRVRALAVEVLALLLLNPKNFATLNSMDAYEDRVLRGLCAYVRHGCSGAQKCGADDVRCAAASLIRKLSEGGAGRGLLWACMRAPADADAKSGRDREKARKAERALLESLKSDAERSPGGMAGGVLHGWLGKLNQNGRAFNPQDWRERLCVCRDGVWSYVSEKKDKVGLLKMFDLDEVRSVVSAGALALQAGREHAFKLVLDGKPPITFAAATAEECERWCNMVRRHLRAGDAPRDRGTSARKSSFESGASVKSEGGGGGAEQGAWRTMEDVPLDLRWAGVGMPSGDKGGKDGVNCLVAILTDGASVSNAAVLSALSHVCGAEDLADHPLPPRRPNANPATLQISAAAAPHLTRAARPTHVPPQYLLGRPQLPPGAFDRA